MEDKENRDIENNPITLGEFRKYTENLPDDMLIHLHDSNYDQPVAIIGIHQKVLVDNINTSEENDVISIILECFEIEIDDNGKLVA